ncbi:MAG: hypothetical protein GY757_27335 [bacterium]|nr:hypothetical protein [bacterium]
MNYELWFPYSKIVNSRYPLKGYLDNFIDSLPVIFEEFGVTDTLISKIRSECEKEILNNKEYELMPVKKENSPRKEISIEEFKRQLGVK